jgi:hypothetical protein
MKTAQPQTASRSLVPAAICNLQSAILILKCPPLLALVSVLSLQPSALVGAAPLGTAFTYQGQLRDGSQPASGMYDLRFAIYDAVTNGSAVGGALTNAATPVTNGLFTATLDFGPSVFNGDARWLEIGVRTNGSVADFTTLSPRQPLTPVPYAIRALRYSGTVAASQLTGTISSNNISAGSITTDMLAEGAVGADQLAVGAMTTDALADGAVTAVKVTTVTVPLLLTTFTNPTPAANDEFGHSVTAVGTDRVLVGARRDDAGATNAGVAYLFSTNGALLTTFTNPTPAAGEWFGDSLAAVGTDQVLIGAPYDDTGASDAGVAYLFSTNGALLTTFTNPTPAAVDHFGFSVAAVGTDRVLIGAPNDNTGASAAGAAYLFRTNGALLTTFTNPTPAYGDTFGISVAAVGTGRVVIGALGDSTGANYAGAAYLFSNNGALLATFVNPTPAIFDYFGTSVAAVGTDWILISADQGDTGASGSEAAYLFSTNGTLLTTFTEPTPAAYDHFGSSVAAVGTNRVLIGAYGVNPGANYAGAAYLFSLETYTPGLIADGVNARSITTASLEDGAVSLAKLDPTIGVWTRAEDDVFRLAGNVGIGTSSFTSNRLEVAGMVGATSFNTTSDRAAKQDFSAVDAQAVLAKVAALPITQWRFKESPGELHLGPVAQDFRAAFGLGLDDKSIATVDADGVALAAIQGLNQKLEDRSQKSEVRTQKLEAENTALKQELAELKALVQTLAEKVSGGGQ